MRRGSDALVVNILDAKLAAPNPDYLSYTLSKYAAARADRAGRAGAGGQGDPGQRDRAGADAAVGGAGRGRIIARVHALNPLARGVEVDDVIGALRFLIDQPAMTGADADHRRRAALHGAAARRAISGATMSEDGRTERDGAGGDQGAPAAHPDRFASR